MKQIDRDYKREIINLLKGNGDWYPRDFNYFGKGELIHFLNELYPLKEMKGMYGGKNAYDDIFRHTISFPSDWDKNGDWVFADERFELFSGDDEKLLKFIVYSFNPSVRNEKQNWKYYLEKINVLLNQCGYEIYEKDKLGEKVKYGWKPINSILMETLNNSKYLSLKLIGEGSYAQVFSFKDPNFKKHYVLKRAKKDLNQKELERFKREYEELSKLNSPNIIEVYHYNENGKENEYIMEKMDCTLKDYIKKNNNTLSFNDKKEIAVQVLHGFEYLSSKTLLHRDISPNNILIRIFDDEHVQAKISDFGLVRTPDSTLTSENTEFKGLGYNDPKLYQIGFDSYNLIRETYAITNLLRFIFEGKDKLQIDKIKNLSLKIFVEKGLNPDDDKRYKSIDELIVWFKSIQEEN